MSFQDRVKAGMSLLDEKNPGWEKKIDLYNLNMSGFYTCVLGQLYGGYFEGMERLFGVAGSSREADALGTEHGFYPGNDWYDANEYSCAGVNNIWIEAIKSRLQ